jgi:stage III sporulation protein AA
VQEIFAVLPETIRQLLKKLPPSIQKDVEEIRIRVHRPLEVIVNHLPHYPEHQGCEYVVTTKDAQFLLNQLSAYSIYAFEEELKRGFITMAGGHRVGLAGKVTLEKGYVKTVRDISSFNIRVAKQKIGTAEPLISHVYQKGWLNTLLIGPPQSGKTTLLRDLARLVSVGWSRKGIPPLKVGIVDERSEIAAAVKGVPQHELGMRVDVLDGCPKAEGMMMMIRSMSPDVLIVDEIGRKEDCVAIQEALHAGVKVMTTAHGYELEEVSKRPAIRELLEIEAFDRCIELERRAKPGVVRRIRNAKAKDVGYVS